MTKTNQLIKHYNEMGLDLNFMERNAKAQGISLRKYLMQMIHSDNPGTHGNVLRRVANFFLTN